MLLVLPGSGLVWLVGWLPLSGFVVALWHWVAGTLGCWGTGLLRHWVIEALGTGAEALGRCGDCLQRGEGPSSGCWSTPSKGSKAYGKNLGAEASTAVRWSLRRHSRALARRMCSGSLSRRTAFWTPYGTAEVRRRQTRGVKSTDCSGVELKPWVAGGVLSAEARAAHL